MRRNVPILPALFLALAVVAASRAGAQNLPEQARPEPCAGPRARFRTHPPAPIDPQKLEELLKLWEKNSANLKSLDVKMTRTDRSPAWGEDDRYEGRAMFKSPQPRLARLPEGEGGRRPGDQERRRNSSSRTSGSSARGPRSGNTAATPVRSSSIRWKRTCSSAPSRKARCPSCSTSRRPTAKKRYEMTLVAENANASTDPDHPASWRSTRTASRRRSSCWTGKLFLLPRRILLIATDGKSSKDFELQLTTQGGELRRRRTTNFQPKVIPGWKVVRNPGGDEKPARRRGPGGSTGTGSRRRGPGRGPR